MKADANKDGKARQGRTQDDQALVLSSSQIDDERLGQMLTCRDADKDGFVSKSRVHAPAAPGPVLQRD